MPSIERWILLLQGTPHFDTCIVNLIVFALICNFSSATTSVYHTYSIRELFHIVDLNCTISGLGLMFYESVRIVGKVIF